MITNWTFDITTFWHLCRARTFPASGYSQRKRPKIARLLAHLPAISNISYKNVNICALQWQASQRATWPLGRLESQCNPQSRGPTIQQSSIQPWPAAPIKAKKLSSQKAAAIAVADMEKPLADFMRFSTVSFLYLLFLYFELPWRGSINYLGNVASYPLIYSLKCIIHFNFHTSKMTQYLSN